VFVHAANAVEAPAAEVTDVRPDFVVSVLDVKFLSTREATIDVQFFLTRNTQGIQKEEVESAV
jgi:hypothetical protein